MNNIILIRYAEIHLKGKNRGFFEKLLSDNIKHTVCQFNAQLNHISGRYVLRGYDPKDEQSILSLLQCVSGIFSFSPAIEVNSNYENIESIVKGFSKDLDGTFKIETNRADKTFCMTSMEVSRKLGAECLKTNKNLSVDVINPQHKIYVDIRENGFTYVYNKVIYGMGGMPVGSSGKGLLLLSGGIDSPVAGYLMAKRGVKVYALHFHSFPYTSPQAKEKVLTLAKQISKYTGQIEVSIVSVTEIQQAIHKHCKQNYMITLLRRFMFKIAEIIAKQKGLDMLITGESLGQVASQTIESITAVESVLKDIVVMRPLIGFDKNETIAIANKINTFETSIEPYEDCCTVFLPPNPIIKPKLNNVVYEESKLDCENLIENALKTLETIVI